jgi:hypothetical protein
MASKYWSKIVPDGGDKTSEKEVSRQETSVQDTIGGKFAGLDRGDADFSCMNRKNQCCAKWRVMV